MQRAAIISGNSRQWTANTAIAVAGVYSVNVLAGNIHSDPFYGVNMKDQNVTLTLVVQSPVEKWVLNAKSFWILGNGCESNILCNGQPKPHLLIQLRFFQYSKQRTTVFISLFIAVGPGAC